MGTTAVRGGIVRFDPNDPVEIQDAKYLDLGGGKYGPQVRVKGTINGQPDSLAYLPGNAADVLNALYAVGIITALPDTYPEESDRRGFPLQKGHVTAFTVTLAQHDGEKETVIESATAAPRTASTTTPAPKPQPTAAPAAQPMQSAADALEEAGRLITAKKNHVARVQHAALDYALTNYAAAYRAAGVEPDSDTLHKLAFELFKMWCDKGLV